MDKELLKQELREKLELDAPATEESTEELTEESAVGKRGRTGKADADVYVEENGELVESFKKIVKKMGGKSVATQLLSRMKMGTLKVPTVEEARMRAEDYFRFKKNLGISRKEFDKFIDLNIVDAYPRSEDGKTRVDIYKKGKHIILGFYYPKEEILTGEDDLINMAFNSMTSR